MSGSRIFQNPTRYLNPEPQGRTINLSTSGVRRSPIFNHIPAEKITSAPFANYTTRSTHNESQSTIGEEKVTAESILNLVQIELDKVQGFSENNRKLISSMQAQLTDVKERLSEYHNQHLTDAQNTAILLEESLTNALTKSVDKKMAEKAEEDTQNLKSFLIKSNKLVLESVEVKIENSAIIKMLIEEIEDIKKKV